MSTLPATGSFLFQGPSVTNTSRGPLFEQWLATTAQLPGGGARQTLAMASGSITPSVALVTVDTQGAAGAGNLDAIQQTNLPAGSVVLLRSADPGRVVTIRHNQGSAPAKILLNGGVNLVLSDITIVLALEATASGWQELWRWPGTSTTTWQSVTGNGAAAALGVAALADMQAGTSATLAATPLGVRQALTQSAWMGALPVRASTFRAADALPYWDGTTLQRVALSNVLLGAPYAPYSTGNLTVAAGAQAAFTHGLGSDPRLMQAALVCVADDAGYSATVNGGDTALPASGVYLWHNQTKLGYALDSGGAGGVRVYNYQSNSVTQVTYASWRLQILAFT